MGVKRFELEVREEERERMGRQEGMGGRVIEMRIVGGCSFAGKEAGERKRGYLINFLEWLCKINIAVATN